MGDIISLTQYVTDIDHVDLMVEITAIAEVPVERFVAPPI